MTSPQVTQKISGYELVWSEVNIVCKVTSVHIHSDGHVTGNLGIFHRKDGKEFKLLNQGNLNFESVITINKFVKLLTEKYQTIKANWTEILDYLSNNIPEWTRAGDCAVEIWAEDDVPAPEKLLDSIIYKGVQNIIYGEKGVLKSTLCYALCAGLGLPAFDKTEFLEFELPQKAQVSLVLDWETSESIFRYYLSRLKKGLNLPTFPLHYRHCRLPLAQDIESIGEYIDNIKADILLIDSLGAAAGGEHGELKSAESALAFNSALRKLDKTALIIGQTSKDQNSHRKTIYGTTFFTYYARNIFELCKGQEDEGSISHLALFHRESNLGKKSSPMGFRFTFDDLQNSIKIEREPVSVAEFMAKVSNNMKILDLLKRGAMSTKELAKEIETSENNIRGACKRLKDSQKILKTEDDKWGLSYKE